MTATKSQIIFLRQRVGGIFFAGKIFVAAKKSVEVKRKSVIDLRFKFWGALFAILSAISFLLPLNVASAEKTIIILVRHGETEYNKTHRYQGALDIPLNETGLHQADLLAERLKDVPIDVFISSPMQRAYVTTEKVAALHDRTVDYADKRLSEASYGDWAGKTFKEIEAEHPKEYLLQWKKRWSYTPPNGESLQSIQKRYRAVLDDVIEKYPGKTILIGAHSAGNSAVICSLLNIPLKDRYNQIKQDNTCVNVLEYEDGKWEIRLMNSIDHLGVLYKGMKKAA